MYVYTLSDALKTMAEHGSLDLTYSREDKGWNLVWTNDVGRFSDTCVDLICCVSNVIRKCKDGLEKIPREARNMTLYNQVCDAAQLLNA